MIDSKQPRSALVANSMGMFALSFLEYSPVTAQTYGSFSSAGHPIHRSAVAIYFTPLFLLQYDVIS